MKKYTVYLSTGEHVYVEADCFDVDYLKRRVVFSVDGENIAFFNFNNIQGFGNVSFSADKDA